MKPTKKNLETRVYGRHACLKIFEKRPQDIVRAYITKEGVFEFRPLIKYLADHKLTYHVVEKEDLDTVTKATHHESICLIVKNKKLPDFKDLMEVQGRSLILCLEEVENPHNLGAIMRSAAHFGVNAIFYEAKVPVANSASAIRTAEGGAETIPALQVKDWSFILDQGSRHGFVSYGTSGHQGQSLFDAHFPQKMFLFMGAEREGLSDKLLKKMNQLIKVPGTGEVESLNVSNATTSILTEWYRQGLVF
jgi:TrmH RNA methyltransferase